uniref:Uncharacterized protein n=1 Tax=Anopheles darlingi TaxID=43151 RepID=A0A2M4DG66_ANODA
MTFTLAVWSITLFALNAIALITGASDGPMVGFGVVFSASAYFLSSTPTIAGLFAYRTRRPKSHRQL